MDAWVRRLAVGSVVVLGCGDDQQSGSGDGSGETSSTDTDVSCEVLLQALFELLQEAAACDPEAAEDTCAPSDSLHDACGCAVVVNTAFAALDQLRSALDLWVAAGCGPYACGAPCPVGTASECRAIGEEGIPPACRWVP